MVDTLGESEESTISAFIGNVSAVAGAVGGFMDWVSDKTGLSRQMGARPTEVMTAVMPSLSAEFFLFRYQRARMPCSTHISTSPVDPSRFGRVKPGKGMRTEIWERSKAADGKVYDPSGPEIKPGDTWQAGHRSGHKFSDAKKRASREGWDDDTWDAYQRDPDIYRPEKPRTNMGHRHESDM